MGIKQAAGKTGVLIATGFRFFLMLHTTLILPGLDRQLILLT